MGGLPPQKTIIRPEYHLNSACQSEMPINKGLLKPEMPVHIM
jgi:hypothetical protein